MSAVERSLTVPGPGSEPRREVRPEVVAAAARVAAARDAAGSSLDELTDATRAAIDIPARVRRDPLRAAALVGGVAFLLLRGPQRLIRRLLRRLRPASRRGREAILPRDVERALRRAGADDPEVRRALEDEFAEYLRRKGKAEPPPDAATTFWHTLDRLLGPVTAAGARILAGRFMESEGPRARARRADRPGRPPRAPRPEV